MPPWNRKEVEVSTVSERPLAGSASVVPSKRRAWRHSWTDMILAGVGAVLAVGSVLLPWYVFLHQDQFGIRALKFENGDTRALGGAGTAPSSRTSPKDELPPEVADSQSRLLDMLATGTSQPRTGDNENPAGTTDQPFPSGLSDFRLVHVANGRALVEDEHGIWLVQTGSFLPDNSRIASIEERDGRWVIVTNSERVIEIAR